ncbi:MAG TPA: hypothetical protein VGL63_12975 [Streptosporangiaceae bacterium]
MREKLGSKSGLRECRTMTFVSSSCHGTSPWSWPTIARNAPGVITCASRSRVCGQDIQCRLAPAVTSAYGPSSSAVSAAPTSQRRCG